MADVAVKPRIEDLPQEALDYFENDELRARCFIEKYALWDLQDHLKETHPTQMWERVAKAVAAPEEDPQRWFEEFSWLLSDFRFVPGGRILHGAGSPRTVTLTNCLVGETIVHTDEGFRSLEELAAQGGHFRARISGKSRWARAWLTGYRETVIIQTREGYRAESTPDHRFRLAEGRWVQAQDLKPGDELALSHDERPFGEPQQDDVLRGYAAGLFVGDGTFAGTNFSVANVRLFDSKAEAPIHAVAEHYGGTVLDYGNHLALNSRKWAADLEDVGIVRGTKTVTDEVMKQSSEYIRGFLRGLFDADSHVAYKTSKNIVLAQSDLDLLRKVQVMLLGFDIRSAIRADDRPYIIGEFPSGSYRCRPVHRLAITRESVQKFQERIGFAHPGKAAKLRRAVESTRFTKDLWHAEVQSVWPSGRVAPVYDMTVQEAHAFSAGGLHAHNCYFTSVEEDSLEAIFEWCKKAARTYSFGGGNGVDIGVLRPQGTPVHNAARTSSGAVSFMELFSTTTGTIGQHGRRGALMITCPVDHPDIQAFIHVKGTDLRSVRYANVSVKVTDEFMQAVQEGKPFTLHFENAWTGRVEKEVDARELWDELIRSAHASAEPGIIFWDHVKQESPSEYLAEAAVAGTNPCGEQPLEHNGACTLGHVNLSAFIRDRFTKQAEVDWVGLERAVRLGVRFLDNVVEVNLPLHAHKEQSEQARLTRRIGLGVTGLGDMLAKLRIQYDSDEAIEFVDDLMARIRNWAYDASGDLAQEKGPFPLFQAEPHLERPFVQRLPEDLREKIRKQGLRNVCILTVAPVGSGSVLTGTSSGVEPIFSLKYLRRSESLSKEWFEVEHPLVREFRKTTGDQDDDLPDFFVTSHQIDPFFRVKMQGTLQQYIDSAISSTVNLAEDTTVETVKEIYEYAWKMGCKGVTVYREGSREGILLTSREKSARGEAGATEAVAVPKEVGKPRARPAVVRGTTQKIETGYGKLYVTINEDESGLFEVFAQIGRGGGYTASFTEAVARLISLCLRSGISADEVIDQMEGIRSPRLAWDHQEKIYSVPDALSKALKRHLSGYDQTTLLPRVESFGPVLDDELDKEARDGDEEMVKQGLSPECPECGSPLIFEENCIKCQHCGFSEC